MNWEKYTIKSQEIIQATIQSAKELGQQAIEPLHLLQALLNGGGHLIEKSIPEASGDIRQLRASTEEAVKKLPRVEGGEPYLSNDTVKLLQSAEKISGEMGDKFVAIEHLLLALLQEENTCLLYTSDAADEQ